MPNKSIVLKKPSCSIQSYILSTLSVLDLKMDSPGAPPTPTSRAVPVLELTTYADLGRHYKGDFWEPGKGYKGTLELHTHDNPVGYYQGYLATKKKKRLFRAKFDY